MGFHLDVHILELKRKKAALNQIRKEQAMMHYWLVLLETTCIPLSCLEIVAARKFRRFRYFVSGLCLGKLEKNTW